MTKTNTYTIWIRTGDDTMAGTDSDVFIQLFGTTGRTESIHLPARDVFSFESGGNDQYVLEVPDVGELTRCCVGHNQQDGDSDWFVVDVRIADDETSREWTFVFNQWVGKNAGGAVYACIDA